MEELLEAHARVVQTMRLDLRNPATIGDLLQSLVLFAQATVHALQEITEEIDKLKAYVGKFDDEKEV